MMDGLKIPIQASGDRKTLNAYYNGWLHDHFINTVFVFAPSGTIVVVIEMHQVLGMTTSLYIMVGCMTS